MPPTYLSKSELLTGMTASGRPLSKDERDIGGLLSDLSQWLADDAQRLNKVIKSSGVSSVSVTLAANVREKANLLCSTMTSATEDCPEPSPSTKALPPPPSTVKALPLPVAVETPPIRKCEECRQWASFGHSWTGAYSPSTYYYCVDHCTVEVPAGKDEVHKWVGDTHFTTFRLASAPPPPQPCQVVFYA